MKGYEQACPKCVGALAAAERGLAHTIEVLEELRADAREMRRYVANEALRARNGDPTHIHVAKGPRPKDACTLESHREEARHERVMLAGTEKQARQVETELVLQTRIVLAATRVLLAGCDLCGRAPIPLRGNARAA